MSAAIPPQLYQMELKVSLGLLYSLYDCQYNWLMAPSLLSFKGVGRRGAVSSNCLPQSGK